MNSSNIKQWKRPPVYNVLYFENPYQTASQEYYDQDLQCFTNMPSFMKQQLADISSEFIQMSQWKSRFTELFEVPKKQSLHIIMHKSKEASISLTSATA